MPVIGIKNIQDRLELNDLLYLSGLSSSDVEKARVSANWTVIVGSNGNRNRIGNAQLIRNDAGFLFASFLIGAKPKSDSGLRPDYFFRWLSSEQVQSYLSASAEGTTGLSNLSHSFFKSMSIPVPPPEEQAAIARILGAVDTALERTRETVQSAEDLQGVVLEDAFARLEAEHCRLGTFATEVRYGTSVASNDKAHGNPVLRIPNVVGDRLALNDLAFVELSEPDVERLRLADGDLLLVRTNGNPNYVGRSSPRQSPQGPPPFTGTEIESGFSSRFDSANSLIRASILWIAASVASSTIPFIDSSNVDLSSFKFLTSDISIPIAVDAAATATIMPTKRVPTFTHLDMLFCSLESGFPIWKPPSPLSVTRNRSTCNSPSNDSHLRADPDD